LAIAMLSEVRQTVRPDLVIIVMSATIDADPVARFIDAPVIRVPGRLHPIEIEHEPSDGRPLETRVAEAVGRSLAGPGDVLVFLPGAQVIHRCLEAIGREVRGEDVMLLPLHGSMDFEDQNRALAPSPKRKIICATNVAETSLTIDG